MTKSCFVISKNHHYKNLHEFLKSKRRILKYAKKTLPNNNWNDLFDPLSVKELNGAFWAGNCLFRKRGSEIIFLATTSPNSNLPKEIIIKSCPIESSSSLEHEKNLLIEFGHCKNLVHCYGDEITTTSCGEKVYNVLLEYCSGASLRDHMINHGLYGLPECEVRRYTRDIVHGLYHLHCNARYVHGDIKPRNILLNGDGDWFAAKIGSFGMARKLTAEVLCDGGVCGSGPYAAPEVARDGCVDWPGDVWALGCVVLEMLVGIKWGFENGCEFGDELLLPQIPKEISSVGRDFVKRCLVRSPFKRRPVWLLIKHPFVCL